MPRRVLKTISAGLFIAAAAIVAVRRVLEAPKVTKTEMTTPVVVALEDISEGRAIVRGSLRVAPFPLVMVPAGAYAAVDSVVGRVARVNIFKGEVIMPRRLVSDSTKVSR